jgi:hypothetical protein
VVHTDGAGPGERAGAARRDARRVHGSPWLIAKSARRVLAGLAVLLPLVLVACGTQPPPYGPASQYLDISPTRAADLSHPYLKGKVVVVWTRKHGQGPAVPMAVPGTIDDSWDFAVPTSAPELHPQHPNEIGTIVWLDCEVRPKLTYSNGQTGYDTLCVVTVIDKAANRIVGTKIITVPAPKSIELTVQNGSPIQDPSAGVPFAPSDEIAAYIESLPRVPLAAPTP